MRHSTSSSEDDASTSSPTPRQRSVRSTHASSRKLAHSPPQPNVLGAVGTLIRLAIFAAILALVVPYVKPYIFGSSTSTSNNNNNSNNVDDVGTRARSRWEKNTYHHIDAKNANSPKQQEEANLGDDGDGITVDVFNFKHEDYIQAAKKATRQKHQAIATPSPSAVISPSSPSKQQQQQQQQRSQMKKASKRSNASSNRARKASTRRIRQSADHDDDDEEEEGEGNDTSTSRNLGETLFSILSTLYSLTLSVFRFITIPFRHLFRLLALMVGSVYRFLRLTLSHTLRPIVIAGAPLTYLISGILFVFVQTPFGLVKRVVTELYPVYIFLGAAAVVGISMGVAAAGVLYVTAFIFVDRVDPNSGAKLSSRFGSRPDAKEKGKGKGKGKGRMMMMSSENEGEGETEQELFERVFTSTNNNNNRSSNARRSGRETRPQDSDSNDDNNSTTPPSLKSHHHHHRPTSLSPQDIFYNQHQYQYQQQQQYQHQGYFPHSNTSTPIPSIPTLNSPLISPTSHPYHLPRKSPTNLRATVA